MNRRGRLGAVRFLVVMLGAALAAPLAARSDDGKVDMEAAEMAAELIGAPVFAADGPEVGEVSDVILDEKNEPQRLRIRAAAHLGLGVRLIDVPKGAFITLRGAAVLEVPAAAVGTLPELSEESGDRTNENK